MQHGSLAIIFSAKNICSILSADRRSLDVFLVSATSRIARPVWESMLFELRKDRLSLLFYVWWLVLMITLFLRQKLRKQIYRGLSNVIKSSSLYKYVHKTIKNRSNNRHPPKHFNMKHLSISQIKNPSSQMSFIQCKPRMNQQVAVLDPLLRFSDQTKFYKTSAPGRNSNNPWLSRYHLLGTSKGIVSYHHLVDQTS